MASCVAIHSPSFSSHTCTSSYPFPSSALCIHPPLPMKLDRNRWFVFIDVGFSFHRGSVPAASSMTPGMTLLSVLHQTTGDPWEIEMGLEIKIGTRTVGTVRRPSVYVSASLHPGQHKVGKASTAAGSRLETEIDAQA